MASAEVVEAWKEYLKTVPMIDQKMRDRASFAAGYLAGRKLPEVAWCDMKFGEMFIGIWKDPQKWPTIVKPYGHRAGIKTVESYGMLHQSSEFTKFLGPLPLEDWGA